MDRPTLDPKGYYRRIPLLPHQMRDRLTATEDTIVLCHLGIPRIDASAWRLRIDGLVERSRDIDYPALLRYPKVEVQSIHQCAGSPLQPAAPTRRICNVLWAGARLADIIADCGLKPEASFLWSRGADHGDFEGVTCDDYLKDLPIERLPHDVLLAYEMNGEPLRPENGFPVRLVVPGFYGTNSVKWINRVTAADTRAPGPFTTRWYNDPVVDRHGRATGDTKPVWSIAPESVIVAPSPDQSVRAGEPCEIWGWAWADGGVRTVAVSADDGATWRDAGLEPAHERAWQRFSLAWEARETGDVTLRSRAEGHDGQVQPSIGRRNAMHEVTIKVA